MVFPKRDRTLRYDRTRFDMMFVKTASVFVCNFSFKDTPLYSNNIAYKEL